MNADSRIDSNKNSLPIGPLIVCNLNCCAVSGWADKDVFLEFDMQRLAYNRCARLLDCSVWS